MLLLKLAARSALRQKRRSTLTLLTVVLGSTLMIIALSFLHGLTYTFTNDSSNRMGHVRIVSAAYEKREALNPIYENIPDVEPLMTTLAAVPGVVSVYPRIQQGVTVSIGEEIGDTHGSLVGVPLDYMLRRLELEKKLVSGRMIEDPETQVILGQELATSIGARVGQSAVFLATTQDGSLSPLNLEVAGIADTGNPQYDRGAYVDIGVGRWAADMPEGAVEVLVFASAADEDLLLQKNIRHALREPPLGDLVVEAWSTREPMASILMIFNRVSGVLMFAVVFVAALGVFNTMMMSVLERTREIGVLRAFGLRKLSCVVMIVLEAAIISMVGGVVGVGLGSAIAAALGMAEIHLGSVAAGAGDNLAVSDTLRVLWTPEHAVAAFGLSILMALLGSIIPAMRAASIAPVESMRGTA